MKDKTRNVESTVVRRYARASVERGVLISRTWYSYAVDPREATITGLTHDGRSRK